jgi:uncharacterized membrane protein YgcG
MGRSLVVVALGLVGLLCAAGIGVAAYVVSRDSVAVPVTRLQPQPQTLTPGRVRARPARARTTTGATTTLGFTNVPPGTTTADDHGGRSRGGSGGSGNSGHGGGGGDD